MVDKGYKIENGDVKFDDGNGGEDAETKRLYQELVRDAGEKTFNVVRAEVNEESLDNAARGKAADWMDKNYKSEKDEKLEAKAEKWAEGKELGEKSALEAYKKSVGYRLKQAAKVAGFATIGFALGGVAGAGMGVMMGLGGGAVKESLNRSIAVRKKYKEFREDDGWLLDEDREALTQRAMIAAEEDLNANEVLDLKRGEEIEKVDGERADEVRKAFIDKVLVNNMLGGENIADNVSDKNQGDAIANFVKKAREYNLEGNKEEYERRRRVLEAYVENNAIVSEAKMNAGLGLKEVMMSSADENALKYGVFAGTVLGLGGQLARTYGKSKITQALGGGNPIKIAAAAVFGGVGAAMKKNRNMKRENLRAAFNGENVEGKGTKYEMISVAGWKAAVEGCLEGENIKADKKEELIQKIADFRARNWLQNEKGVALLAFSGREGIEKEKLEMFELIAEAKRGLNDDEKAQLEAKFGENREKLEKKIEETASNRRKAAMKAGLKGALAGAVSAAVFTYGMNWLKNTNVVKAAEEWRKDRVEDVRGLFGIGVAKNAVVENEKDNVAKEAKRAKGTGETKDSSSVKKTEVEQSAEAKVETETRARSVNLEEYMNDKDNKEVLSYSRVNFDGSRGVAFGKPELCDDGYHIAVANAPEGTCFAVNVGTSGQVLTAEVHNGYALLPANSAIFDTVQDVNGDGIPDFTGNWVSAGTMNADGSFTSFVSAKCDAPFDGVFNFMEGVDATGVVAGGAEHVMVAKEVEITNDVETVKLANGETVGLDLVKGGYEPTADPFLMKPDGVSAAAFGEAITARTPEEAMSQWVVSIQKSPDQLVWNAAALDGFNKDADVTKFFVEHFGVNWKEQLGIDGVIDTEEEVNSVANAIAGDARIYEGFKRLFLRELDERMDGGNVVFQAIANGGRYTNLAQANQFISGDSDVTGSIVRATSARTGGNGFVMTGRNGGNLFDEKITRKLLKIPEGQKVGETVVRTNCGGQMTREKVAAPAPKSEPKTEIKTESVSESKPESTPDQEPGASVESEPVTQYEAGSSTRPTSAPSHRSGSHVRHESEPKSEPEPVSEPVVESEPESVSEPVFTPEPEPVSEPEIVSKGLETNVGESAHSTGGGTEYREMKDYTDVISDGSMTENVSEIMSDTTAPEAVAEAVSDTVAPEAVAEAVSESVNSDDSADELSDIFSNIMGGE